MLLKLSESTTMKIEKDKFNSLSEKDQNLQLLRVRRFLLISNIQIDSLKDLSKHKKLFVFNKYWAVNYEGEEAWLSF